MTDLYATPPAQENQLLKDKLAFWRKVRTFSILLILGPPLLGLAGTVIGMMSAFQTLSETGQAEPGDLSGPISFALLTTMYGLILSLLAVIPLVLALTKLRFYRKKNLPLKNENY